MASLFNFGVQHHTRGLNFVAATDDRVSLPNLQPLGAGSSFTWVIYCRQTGSVTTNATGLLQAGGVDGFVWQTTAGGRWRFVVPRATTAGDRRTADDPFTGAGGTAIIIGTYSESDGPRFYYAHAFKAPTEPTYATDTTGSGNTTDDTGLFVLGNRAAGNSLSMGVDILAFAWYPWWMAKAELVEYWDQGWPTDGSTFYGLLGTEGPGWVRDLSGHGNHGICTGLTPATHFFGGAHALVMKTPIERYFQPSFVAAAAVAPGVGALMLTGQSISLGFTIHMPDEL
jgi:hypothetical protein